MAWRKRTINPVTLGLALVTAALLVLVVSPVLAVVAGSFLDTALLGISSEQWVGASGGADGGERTAVTFRWFAYVWRLYRPQAVFSLELAVLSVGICLLFGVPGGYVLTRSRFRGSRIIEELLLLPLALPGIAVAIGLIQAYAIIRGRWWLVLGGHLLYTLPFMVRTVTNTLRSFDSLGLERAARSLGAGFWQRFFWVVLPNLRHAMIVGSLLVFALSWGEFNVSYLLNTPLNQTFPAALYATYTFNSYQVSSAATTLFLLVLLPVLIAVQTLGGSRGVKAEQGA